QRRTARTQPQALRRRSLTCAEYAWMERRSGPHVVGAPVAHLALHRVGGDELSAQAPLHEPDELVVARVAQADELPEVEIRDALAELDRQDGGEAQPHLETDDPVLDDERRGAIGDHP